MSALFSTPEVTELFSERALVAAMLRVEWGLARALSRAEVIPTAAADTITAACRIDLYDPDAIFAESATARSTDRAPANSNKTGTYGTRLLHDLQAVRTALRPPACSCLETGRTPISSGAKAI